MSSVIGAVIKTMIAALIGGVIRKTRFRHQRAAIAAVNVAFIGAFIWRAR